MTLLYYILIYLLFCMVLFHVGLALEYIYYFFLFKSKDWEDILYGLFNLGSACFWGYPIYLYTALIIG